MSETPPFSKSFDLGAVPEKGVERTLKPSAAERSKIAAWLGIEALESFEAVVNLKRSAFERYLYSGHFEADVVQACVVTLEPVPAHLSGDFERSFQIAQPAGKAGRRGGKIHPPPVVALTDLDDDSPEMLDSPVVDLAAPLLEELSLSLDPYPRKPGVAFAPPEDDAGTEPDNPFAVLKKLKDS